jgi:hypothetical protein
MIHRYLSIYLFILFYIFNIKTEAVLLINLSLFTFCTPFFSFVPLVYLLNCPHVVCISHVTQVRISLPLLLSLSLSLSILFYSITFCSILFFLILKIESFLLIRLSLFLPKLPLYAVSFFRPACLLVKLSSHHLYLVCNTSSCISTSTSTSTSTSIYLSIYLSIYSILFYSILILKIESFLLIHLSLFTS